MKKLIIAIATAAFLATGFVGLAMDHAIAQKGSITKGNTGVLEDANGNPPDQGKKPTAKKPADKDKDKDKNKK